MGIPQILIPLIFIDPAGFQDGNPISFNRFAYANDNPYKFVDPDGRDAIITYLKNGDISIKIPIRFSGEGVKVNDINKIKRDIAKVWSGKYDVNGKSTNVTVEVTKPVKDGMTNNIELTGGQPTSKRSCSGCSFVSGGDSGEWRSPRSAPHEAGHLMGAGDHYRRILDENGIRVGTKAHDGWEGNLMGDGTRSTNNRNMREILKSERNKNINRPRRKRNEK